MLPTWWTLTLAAQGRPSLALLVIFAAGSFLMRSAGVAVNDLADRSFDRQVPRTRSRPLAAGTLTGRTAMVVFGLLLLPAAGLLLFLNPLTRLISPIALLLAILYPFAKRVIPIPQVILGAAFGWGVVMAWTAARNSLDWPAWLLYGATVLWALAYDTIYAMQDREDDRRIGIRSSAIYFGDRAWMAVGAALGVMFLLLAWAGHAMGAGPVYYGVLALVGGFLTHQIRRLRHPISPSEALALFRQHVWAGWAILAGLLAGFW